MAEMLVRRLLSGLLALALVQFSATATAPAHAHEGDHAVATIAVDMAIDDHGHGRGHSHPATTAPLSPEAAPAQSPDDEPRGNSDSSEAVTHIHGYAQFAPVEASDVNFLPSAMAAINWPIGQASPTSHLSAPPLRPPRPSL